MASVQELVTQLGQDDQAASFKAHKDLQDQAHRATTPGRNAERAQLAAALAAELVRQTAASQTADGKEVPASIVHSAAVRDKVARLLGAVATAKEVPALEQAMADVDVREGVLYALACSRLPEATAALIKALEMIGPEFRVGAVNALGYKGTADAEAALRKAAKDDDPCVALAAVEALANYPDPANDAHLVAASQCGHPTAAARANKARIRLAAALDKAGRHDDAVKVYRSIAESKADQAQKNAAKLALAGKR